MGTINEEMLKDVGEVVLMQEVGYTTLEMAVRLHKPVEYVKEILDYITRTRIKAYCEK